MKRAMVRAVRVRASAARAMVTEEPPSSLPSLKQMRIRLLVRQARGKYNILSPTADPMTTIPGGEIVKFVLSQHRKLRFKSGQSQITNHKSQITNLQHTNTMSFGNAPLSTNGYYLLILGRTVMGVCYCRQQKLYWGCFLAFEGDLL